MSDGFEITLNGRYRGTYLKAGADKKMKALMGRRKWSSAWFSRSVVYHSGDDRLKIKNVGCYKCAQEERRRA